MQQCYAIAVVCRFYDGNGEGGIRTLDTLLGYGALAKRCFRPLSHLTKIGCENMANNRRLPTACVK